MKALHIPFNGYFLLGRTGGGLFKNCQYGRHYCGVRAVNNIHREVRFKPKLDATKQKNVDIQKRFFSNSSSGDVILMNYDVWFQPKILPYFKDLYYFTYGLKNIDESFSLHEFKLSSSKALAVVTNLLSKRRFSELEGLLTPECRKEVEDNLTKNWKVSQVEVLAVDPDSVVLCFPCDVGLVSAGNMSAEKSFLEIRVIHYAWLTYTSDFYNEPVFKENTGKKLLMAVVFNCKFIKEVTQGISSQWIISAINLKKLSGVFSTR